MTSQPEKLFRDKLESFQRPAPAAAWDRIEAGLDKTSNKNLWMKIAAGFLLLSVAAFILWPTTTLKTTELANTKNNSVPKIEPEQKNNTEAIAPTVIAKHTTEEKSITSKKKVIKKNTPALAAESAELNKSLIEPSKTESHELVVAEM